MISPISQGQSCPDAISAGIIPNSTSCITSHESIVLERPSLSMTGAPKSEENIFGSRAQKPTNPVHSTLPVVERMYHGSKICINWLASDEKASVVRMSFKGVLCVCLVSNSIVRTLKNYIKW